MAVISITMNINTANYDDESEAMCSFVEMLNSLKEKVRCNNYTLDKYSTATYEVTDVNNRSIMTIIAR